MNIAEQTVYWGKCFKWNMNNRESSPYNVLGMWHTTLCECNHIPFASRSVLLKINSLIVLNSALNEFCNSIKCILALNSLLVKLWLVASSQQLYLKKFYHRYFSKILITVAEQLFCWTSLEGIITGLLYTPSNIKNEAILK